MDHPHTWNPNYDLYKQYFVSQITVLSLWADGVVVSMFDFHRTGRGGEIS